LHCGDDRLHLSYRPIPHVEEDYQASADQARHEYFPPIHTSPPSCFKGEIPDVGSETQDEQNLDRMGTQEVPSEAENEKYDDYFCWGIHLTSLPRSFLSLSLENGLRFPRHPVQRHDTIGVSGPLGRRTGTLL